MRSISNCPEPFACHPDAERSEAERSRYFAPGSFLEAAHGKPREESRFRASVLLIVAAAFVVKGLAAQASPPASADQGAFVLMLSGKKIGVENFQIRQRGEDIDARAQIEFRIVQGGRNLDFKTFPDLLLNSHLEPLTYNWSQTGSQSSRIQIDFRQSPARVRYRTVSGRQDNREFNLPPNVVILDDNVVEQYELIVWRYDKTPGGKQSFPAFTPQEALPGTLTVESLGSETLELGGRKETCRHLVVSTDLARIDLWVDSHQRIERMERSGFVAVREQ